MGLRFADCSRSDRAGAEQVLPSSHRSAPGRVLRPAVPHWGSRETRSVELSSTDLVGEGHCLGALELQAECSISSGSKIPDSECESPADLDLTPLVFTFHAGDLVVHADTPPARRARRTMRTCASPTGKPRTVFDDSGLQSLQGHRDSNPRPAELKALERGIRPIWKAVSVGQFGQWPLNGQTVKPPL